MTFIFIKLVRFADKEGVDGKLPVPVHILADELANTGRHFGAEQKNFRYPEPKFKHFLYFSESASNAEPVSAEPMAGNYREL